MQAACATVMQAAFATVVSAVMRIEGAGLDPRFPARVLLKGDSRRKLVRALRKPRLRESINGHPGLLRIIKYIK